MMRQRIYFSHAIADYYSYDEQKAIKAILHFFPNAIIINPRDFHFNNIESYLDLVKTSSIVVFKRFMGAITAGVGSEIKFALNLGIPVYEIKGTKLERLSKLNESILTREETIKLFRLYRKVEIYRRILLNKIPNYQSNIS